MSYHRSEFIYFASLAQKACRCISGTPEARNKANDPQIKFTLLNLLSKNDNFMLSFFSSSLICSLIGAWRVGECCILCSCSDQSVVMTLGTGLQGPGCSPFIISLYIQTNPQAREWAGDEKRTERLLFLCAF